MTTPLIINLEKLIGTPRDNALLRFGLGNEYLKAGDASAAANHLAQAVSQDPAYSAAWKLLGKALADCERPQESLEAYRKGIEAAEKKGDKQAAKEMTVFAKRIEKQLAENNAKG